MKRESITITRRQLQTMLAALPSAILSEEDFLGCHLDPYTHKPHPINAKVCKKTSAFIVAMYKLQRELKAKL